VRTLTCLYQTVVKSDFSELYFPAVRNSWYEVSRIELDDWSGNAKYGLDYDRLSYIGCIVTRTALSLLSAWRRKVMYIQKQKVQPLNFTLLEPVAPSACLCQGMYRFWSVPLGRHNPLAIQDMVFRLCQKEGENIFKTRENTTCSRDLIPKMSMAVPKLVLFLSVRLRAPWTSPDVYGETYTHARGPNIFAKLKTKKKSSLFFKFTKWLFARMRRTKCITRMPHIKCIRLSSVR